MGYTTQTCNTVWPKTGIVAGIGCLSQTLRPVSRSKNVAISAVTSAARAAAQHMIIAVPRHLPVKVAMKVVVLAFAEKTIGHRLPERSKA